MINVLPNTTVQIGPRDESRDTGWVISGQYAIHYPCNPGKMRSKTSAGIQVGKSYVMTYTIDNYVSGVFRVSLGTTNGITRSSAGTYTEVITCNGTAEIGYYSDGALRVTSVSYYEQVVDANNAITLAFFDGEGTNKKWGTYYSYSPEMMIKFLNNFFTIKNGALWRHNTNPIHNNFYGTQYVSKIQFFDNINPTTTKIFYSIRVQSNRVWFCPDDGDIFIPPVVGRAVGMSSRLKSGNFNNYQGSFYADFMRNQLDTRFGNQQLALFKGEPLRGRFLGISLLNDDTSEVILYEIDIKSAPAAITY